jgi:hypothetical protein
MTIKSFVSYSIHQSIFHSKKLEVLDTAIKTSFDSKHLYQNNNRMMRKEQIKKENQISSLFYYFSEMGINHHTYHHDLFLYIFYLYAIFHDVFFLRIFFHHTIYLHHNLYCLRK